jgi:hypothetical protein
MNTMESVRPTPLPQKGGGGVGRPWADPAVEAPAILGYPINYEPLTTTLHQTLTPKTLNERTCAARLC